MDLIEATVKALQGKLEEKPNKDNAEINSKILEPNVNTAELQRNGYNVSRKNGYTSVKRADRVNDFREIDVFDDGTVMTANDNIIDVKPIKNKKSFDAKSFLDTNRRKLYDMPNKVSRFKLNKDTIAQADEEIGKAEISKEEHPEDAEILDKNVIEPWKKLSDKANAENRRFLKKESAPGKTNEDSINSIIADKDFMNRFNITPEDIINQVKISTEEFKEISKYVSNYTGTLEELCRELNGWNFDEELFDCYYKSLLVTIKKDGDKLKVVPTDVYVYPANIKGVDTDALFYLDFDKAIDYSKIKIEENLSNRRVLGEHVFVEDKECLKEETLTWEDIMTNAEGTTFGQQALKVKDTARDNVEKLLVKAGIDIDNVESVEDEIEKYCKDNNIKFDTHGNLVTEGDKITEGIKVGDRIKIITYNNHPDEDLLDWADKQSTDTFEVSEVDNDSKVFYIKDCEYGIPFDSDDYITVKDKVTEDVVTMEEAFYEKICRAYVNTANLEWVTTNPENNNSVVHGYFADDNEAEKWDYGAKVTPKNFKDIVTYTDEEVENGDFDKALFKGEYYEYDTWEDFYEEYVKGEILYDIDDIGTYPSGTTEPYGDWDFYISKEDLIKLGLWEDTPLDENKEIREDVNPEYLISINGLNYGQSAYSKGEVVRYINDYKKLGLPLNEITIADSNGNNIDIKAILDEAKVRKTVESKTDTEEIEDLIKEWQYLFSIMPEDELDDYVVECDLSDEERAGNPKPDKERLEYLIDEADSYLRGSLYENKK